METISTFEYKGNEIIILLGKNDLYAVDIRIDDYDGHMMAGYCHLASESEAQSVSKAFVDGLRLVEEIDIQHR